MSPEEAVKSLAKSLLVAHARRRLARVAAIVAARAPLGEDEARALLEIEIEGAVSETVADALGDLRDVIDGD